MRSDLNFNSIKVQLRLKPADDQHFEDQDFNSIKVQLRLQTFMHVFFPYPDFNSIKVQLRPEENKGPDGEFIFQFHKGTIKTAL